MTFRQKTSSRHVFYFTVIFSILAFIDFTSLAYGQATLQEVRGFRLAPSSPQGGVIDGGDGYLYGTTYQGGDATTGTVYKVKPDGSSFAVVHSFEGDCSDGCYPLAGVILAADGFLYGTTASGGPSGYGTVFKVKPDGTAFSTVHGFNSSDGGYPYAGVILANGSIYGTTYQGGSHFAGTVYRLITTVTVSADFFLHGSGPTANPSTLFLDGNTPTGTTAKYKDSAAIKFSGGNSWKEIGTWTAPAALSSGMVSALNNLRTWIGLKNSDDQGTWFDLRAEVYKNSTLVASGETFCIQGVTRNADQAKEVSVSFNPPSPMTFNGTTDVLSLKLLTRIGTNGSGAFVAVTATRPDCGFTLTR